VVIDDDEDVLLSARLLLRDMFRTIEAFQSPADALDSISGSAPEAILLDANFGRGETNSAEGLHWLSEILNADPEAVVVMITAHGGLSVAVEAMKRGATDFVSKPWSNERLLATVRTAASLRKSREAAATDGKRGSTAAPPRTIVGDQAFLGQSPGIARVFSLIDKAGPTDANVLILGENGTGKELVARELHRRSLRAEGPLVSVDIGAVAENLFEAELFGHAKGAFTGAQADRLGRIPAADGGTLFLDEIGNLPLHLQPKLLTALEQRQVIPVGANKAVPVNVRVIAATNLPVEKLHDERRFRQDLLFRLNTVEIELPPLRERRDDILMLVHHFVDFYSRKYGKPKRTLGDDLAAAIEAHDWPGNVRALRHASERAVILGEGEAFRLEDFSLSRRAELGVATPASLRPVGNDLNLDRAERQLVEAALRKHGYNISSAATELGLSRAALYRRMEKYGL
jgi:DNA-binding NtrC family response regulator